MKWEDYQLYTQKITLKNLAIRELLIKQVYSKNMTNQQINKIVEEIKAGKKIPRSTVQMIIGQLWNINEKHKNNSEYEKADKIISIIDQLKKLK